MCMWKKSPFGIWNCQLSIYLENKGEVYGRAARVLFYMQQENHKTIGNAKKPIRQSEQAFHAKKAKAKAAANVVNLTDTLSAAPVKTGL